MVGSNSSIERLPESFEIFPHGEFKEHQGALMRFLIEQDRSLVHAPTGFGKTTVALAALLPEVKKGSQLVIFTRTKAQIFHVYFRDILRVAKKTDYKFIKAVPLINKLDLCPIALNHKAKGSRRRSRRFFCQKSSCPLYAKSKDIPEEEFEVILEWLPLARLSKEITAKDYAASLGEHGCPFYIIRRAMKHADIILTTHFYIRSPPLKAILTHDLLETESRPRIALVDEVHNFSPTVISSLPLKTVRAAKKIYPWDGFQVLKKLLKGSQGRVARPSGLSPTPLRSFLDISQKKLTMDQKGIIHEVTRFLELQTHLWVTQEVENVRKMGDTIKTVHDRELLLVEPFPAKVFQFLDREFSKVIAMSGTLVPIDHYRNFFGIPHYSKWAVTKEYKYQLNAILSDKRFTSKWGEYSDYKTPALMSELIVPLHRANPHHTLVCCSSHRLKTQLMEFLNTPYIETTGGLPDSYIEELSSQSKVGEGQIILGVTSGRLSEGLEILDPVTGRSLITLVVVCGLPFTRPDALSQVLLDAYTKEWGKNSAEEFLIWLPTIRNVLQTVGRGVRNPYDYSASVILDYRASTVLRRVMKFFTFYKPQPLVWDVGSFFKEMRERFES